MANGLFAASVAGSSERSPGLSRNITLAIIGIMLLTLVLHAISRRAAERARALQAARRDFSPAERQLVLAHAKGRCEYCTRRIGPPAMLLPRAVYECDHIVAFDLGGPTTLANAAAACAPCNQLKKNKTWDQFEVAFRQRHGYRPRRPRGHAG